MTGGQLGPGEQGGIEGLVGLGGLEGPLGLKELV